MDPQKRELLTFGFVREYCKDNKMELITDDIIKLFILWSTFCDQFDRDLTYKDYQIARKMHDKYGEYQQAMLQDYQYAHCSAICHNVIKKEIKHSGHFKLEEEDLQTPP